MKLGGSILSFGRRDLGVFEVGKTQKAAISQWQSSSLCDGLKCFSDERRSDIYYVFVVVDVEKVE